MIPMRQFTTEQLNVIEHDTGHALVNAVAGSGKSTTMVEFIARKIERGMHPGRVLALMFNVEARRDFEEKLSRRLPNLRALPKVRTFNSLGQHLYQRLVEMGRLEAQTLIPSSGAIRKLARPALKHAWAEFHGPTSSPTKIQQDDFLRFISLVKADIRSTKEVFEHYDFQKAVLPYIAAFEVFEEARINGKWRFYHDQMALPVRHLLQTPDDWSALLPPFDLIVVDEFQDTSRCQYEAIVGLTSERTRVMAVGDDDQTIYSFIGSIGGTLQTVFEQKLPTPTTYVLSRTFRFGHELGLFASTLIAKNKDRLDKLTISHETTPDTRIHLIHQVSGQATGIVHIASVWQDEGVLSKAAVLLRFYAQGIATIMELDEAGIPFHVYGELEILRVPSVAALIGVLYLVSRRQVEDENALSLMMRGLISFPSLYLLKQELQVVMDSMTTSYLSGRFSMEALRKLAQNKDRFDDRAVKRIIQRCDAIDLVASGAMKGHEPARILRAYMALSDFYEPLMPTALDADLKEAKTNVDAFLSVCNNNPDLESLLSRLDYLLTSSKLEPPKNDHLSIRTIHSVKGAEFDHVVLPAWAYGTFPRESDNLEEERRLAYVAVTRAKKNLYFMIPDDPELERLANDATATRSFEARLSASSFLFEGDLGTSRIISAALREGKDVLIPLARTTIASRYLPELGGCVVKVTQHGERRLPEHGARHEEGVPNSVVGNRKVFKSTGRAVVHPVAFGSQVTDGSRVLAVQTRRVDGKYLLSDGQWDDLRAETWRQIP